MQDIRYNDTNISLYYDDGNGVLHIKHKQFSVQNSFKRFDTYLFAKTMVSHPTYGMLNSTAVVDFTNHTIYAKLEAHIENVNATPTLYCAATMHQVAMSLATPLNISDTHQITGILPIKHEIRQWFHDKVSSKKLSISSADTWFTYDNVTSALKHLRVQASSQQLHYRFADQFKPVYSAQTDLEFKNGTLIIQPHTATFYTLQSSKTWLDINFLDESMLHLHLKLPGQLNTTVQQLIHSYKIDIPIEQTSGVTDTNLDLNISLRNGATTAQGKFHIIDSNFTIANTLPIYIKDANFSLYNAKITLHNSEFNYKDILHANANGFIDFTKTLASIHAVVDEFSIKNEKNSFIKNTKPITLHYQLTPKNESIQIDDASYIVNAKKQLTIDKINVKTTISKGQFHGIPTYFSFSDIAQGYVGFDFNASASIFNASIDLLSFKLNDLQLNQSTLPISIDYDGNTTRVTSPSSSLWRFNRQKFVISPTSLILDGNRIEQKNSTLIAENLLSTNISSIFNIQKDTGEIILNNINIIDPNVGTLFSRKDALHIDYASKNSKTIFTLNELNSTFSLKNKQWEIAINSLMPYTSQLSLLSDYNISNGKLLLKGNASNNQVQIDANISESYGYLYDNNTVTYQHSLHAMLNNTLLRGTLDGSTLSINTTTNEINVSNLAINTKAISNYLDEHPKQNTSSPKLSVLCNQCQLTISKERRVLSDKILLFVLPNSTVGKLSYHNGEILLYQQHDDLTITGDNLDDTFMNAIYSDSNFLNGKMSFEIHSSNHAYLGTMQITDTYLKEQRLLNNIFAFINTLPALTSFSLPSFSTKGLYVQDINSSFYYDKQTLYINTFELTSKDLEILANGNIDLQHQILDLKINLITDIGSGFSKIPVVGYIIMGEDGHVQTSMTMKGALEDPKIETTLAKEIINVPFNIIKRTITFPFELFK